MNTKKQILGPNQIKTNVFYAITINPNDDYQYFKEGNRIQMAENHMKFIIRKFCNIDLDLIIDVSRTGRIHWHGVIRFKTEMNIRDFYEKIIIELLSKHNIDIDTIADPQIWSEYCMKTIHLWKNKLSTAELMKTKLNNIANKNVYKDITEF